MKTRTKTGISALLALASAAALASESGYFGIGLAIDGEGFFLNPTIKSLRVRKVNAGSPAAKAGITEGDEIVEVEGKRVVGAKARELQPYIERAVGETIHFIVKKASGETKQLSMKAEAKPD